MTAIGSVFLFPSDAFFQPLAELIMSQMAQLM